jgi:ribosomal protein S12 methylthiotransferase
MLSLLAKDGLELTDQEEEADIIIVNSCCFISDAMEESIQTLIDMGKYKESGSLKYLLVTGCLAERYSDEIMEQIPEVDGIVGSNAYAEIIEVLHEVMDGKKTCRKTPMDYLPNITATGRLLSTGGHYAYIKIAEGCDKRCTYCVIPSIRGRYRSYPMIAIAEEACDLAAQGVQELILVAQETTVYGVDLYGRKFLPNLLDELSDIQGLHWIRLQYCYPEEITSELIEAMASNPKICHYIDMPIQHANDEILHQMGRFTDQAAIRATVAALRQAMPDICIRTTVMCGFPGETEAMHQELLAFIEEMKFDRLGCFAYSQQEGTPAAELADQVPEEIKQARVDEVMQLQQRICAQRNQELVSTTMEVFVEGKVVDEDAYVARSYRDAPDVDGLVFIQTQEELESGQFVTVKITGALEYDLIGELV